jgi:hypothetical protein
VLRISHPHQSIESLKVFFQMTWMICSFSPPLDVTSLKTATFHLKIWYLIWSTTINKYVLSSYGTHYQFELRKILLNVSNSLICKTNIGACDFLHEQNFFFLKKHSSTTISNWRRQTVFDFIVIYRTCQRGCSLQCCHGMFPQIKQYSSVSLIRNPKCSKIRKFFRSSIRREWKALRRFLDDAPIWRCIVILGASTSRPVIRF